MITYCGNSLTLLDKIKANSIDAVITDPPAGISLLGNSWDNPDNLDFVQDTKGFSRNPVCKKCHKYKRIWKNHSNCLCENPDFDTCDASTFNREKFVSWLSQIMRKCLQVTKPGGYALVWSLPKTSHWTAKAIENAGWQMHGSIAHIFSQGLPKSFNVALAIDRMLIKTNKTDIEIDQGTDEQVVSEEAKKWIGWGTSLKPAYERWILARKPGNDKQTRNPQTFYYCAKTAKAEKNTGKIINDHPTVKSIKLMTFLIKSIADTGDTILDPFMGSGSTGVACLLNGYQFTGIEKEKKYFEIAQQRLNAINSEITIESF